MALSSSKLETLQLPLCLYLRLSCWHDTDKESAGNKRKAWPPRVPVMKITCKMFDNVSVAIFFSPTSLSFVSECHCMHELGQISENHCSGLKLGNGTIVQVSVTAGGL